MRPLSKYSDEIASLTILANQEYFHFLINCLNRCLVPEREPGKQSKKDSYLLFCVTRIKKKNSVVKIFFFSKIYILQLHCINNKLRFLIVSPDKENPLQHQLEELHYSQRKRVRLQAVSEFSCESRSKTGPQSNLLVPGTSFCQDLQLELQELFPQSPKQNKYIVH